MNCILPNLFRQSACETTKDMDFSYYFILSSTGQPCKNFGPRVASTLTMAPPSRFNFSLYNKKCSGFRLTGLNIAMPTIDDWLIWTDARNC